MADDALGAAAPAADADGAQYDLPKLVRIAAMMQSLLAEVGSVDLGDDEPARRRLATIQRRAVDAIAEVVPAEVAAELHDVTPAPPTAEATEGELRLVQSQVTGWLAGLFQAFQAVALEQQQLRAAPGRELAASGIPRREPPAGSYL
jgi:hypothetical protein